MIDEQKLSDSTALGIFAVYCCLVELGGVFGAYMAEKMLGLRLAVMIGGWLIGIGHLLLALDCDFFVALGVLIIGSSLYTTNVATLLGEFYPPGDTRREQGFTIFYMSINIGAFLATLLCGYIAKMYGWNSGFGLAAIGMVLANISLLVFRSCLNGRGEPPLKRKQLLPAFVLSLGVAILALHQHSVAIAILPWMAGGVLIWIFAHINAKEVIISVVGLIVFFAAGEQISSSLLLLAERTGAEHIPSAILLAINPFVIMIGGVVSSILLRNIRSDRVRFLLPFVLAAGAFGLLFLLEPSILLVACVIAVISFAELFIGPLTYSACSEAALVNKDPKVMALMPLGFSLAASLGGVFSQTLAGNQFDIERYSHGFGLLALGLLVVGGILAGFIKASRKQVVSL